MGEYPTAVSSLSVNSFTAQAHHAECDLFHERVYGFIPESRPRRTLASFIPPPAVPGELMRELHACGRLHGFKRRRAR